MPEAPASDLAALQTTLHRAVTAPRPDTWGPAGALLAPSPMSPERRLTLYGRGYRARLLESLRHEYPALSALMGATVFDLFAEGYIEACPPTSPSLHDLGSRFPAWLEETQPAGVGQGDIESAPAQLARLERAWSGALRARGPEGLVPPPADLLLHPAGRLKLPATTVLLRLDFDFAPLLAAVADGDAPPTPEARPTLVAIARGDYRVRLHTLGPGRFAWLQALGPHGGSAQAAAAAADADDPARLLADLILWLPMAIQAGLVVAD
ncbi:MAG: DNA-binding domain-containing protein [Caulobacter sp.]|nr:DNA-binding domain-containing protein [Caulobacter sp.]